ncbi:hypothetical protein [Salinicoccus albus]|uniref:hypothetical protein n=1 Tax=Salinicoccus albus TaxID=418756 RepID=UPI00035C65B8|nr:hypothetical protein [Salinicoccus albus]
MSNYQVRLIILSKADRKYFGYLNIDHKKYYSIAVIDECLKHIQEAVKQSFQKAVKIRFHLVENIDVEDGKKQETVELGTFEYEITPSTQFLNEDRFYQIAEKEIYLNSSNANEAYKKEVLENIAQAKEVKSPNTIKKQRIGNIKDTLVNKWLGKRIDVTEPDHQSENSVEDLEANGSSESETRAEGEQEIEQKVQDELEESTEETNEKVEQNIEANENGESSDTEETVNAESEENTDTEKEKKVSVDDGSTVDKAENESESESSLSSEAGQTEAMTIAPADAFNALIDIPDFQLPRVMSRDIFLKQSDDPVENKRLSFLFDRETRLASYKEQRLIEIYHTLVDNYNEYLLANEQDIDTKLEEYERSRESFVEEYIHDLKAQVTSKLDDKVKTVDQQQQDEMDDFKAEQTQARHRFEERQNNEQEEMIAEYKERLQKEVKAEKAKAEQKFEEKKEALREELKQKVQADVYNYVMLDKQAQIKLLNDEIFEYDENTYRQLDENINAWKTDVENQQHKHQTAQHEGMEQAKYEAEKEKAQADILAMKEKDRAHEANAQHLQAQELEQKQNEMAYKKEEQRLKAIEVDAKHKEAEAKKKEAERMVPMNVRKIAGIVTGAVLVLFILIMFAFQLFFNGGAEAEVINEAEQALGQINIIRSIQEAKI